ncbi:hypothetical protein FRC11_001742, partial [Ceratobasidium sp. 423]
MFIARETVPVSPRPPRRPRRLAGVRVASRHQQSPISIPQASLPQVSIVNALEYRFDDRREAWLGYVGGLGHISSTKSSACPVPPPNQGGQRLDRPDDEETHANHLAATLHRLSNQLANTGDLEDALILSQGAAEL